MQSFIDKLLCTLLLTVFSQAPVSARAAGPSMSEAMSDFARAAQATGKLQAKISAPGETASTESERSPAQAALSAAINAQLAGSTAVALARLDEAIKLDPELELAYASRGLIYYVRHDYARAAADLTQAARLRPNDWEHQVNLGFSLAMIGKAKEGIPHIDKALELNPGSAAVLLNRGHAALLANKGSEAREYYAKVAAMIPNEEELAGIVKDLERLKDRPGMAKAVARETTFFQREYQRLNEERTKRTAKLDELLKKGEIAFNAGQLDQAEAAWEEATKVDPTHAAAFSNLVGVYLKRKEPEKALAMAEKAVTVDPESAQANLNLAVILFNKGDYDRSLQAAMKANELLPAHPQPYLMMGDIYAKKGQYAEGVAVYERMIKDQVHVRAERQRQGDGTATLVTVPSAADAEIYESLGKMYAALGDYGKALPAFVRQCELAPNDADAWFNAGASFLHVGNSESALEYLRRAARLGSREAQGYLGQNNLDW